MKMTTTKGAPTRRSPMMVGASFTFSRISLGRSVAVSNCGGATDSGCRRQTHPKTPRPPPPRRWTTCSWSCCGGSPLKIATSAPSRSPTYAPSEFAKQPEAKKAKASAKALTDAMERLFAMNKLKVVTEGPPSRQRTKIIEMKDAPDTPQKATEIIAALGTVLIEWKAAIGVGDRLTLQKVIDSAVDHPGLKAALLAVAPLDGGSISNVQLARWLRGINEVVVDGLMLQGGGVDDKGDPYWTLVEGSQ